MALGLFLSPLWTACAASTKVVRKSYITRRSTSLHESYEARPVRRTSHAARVFPDCGAGDKGSLTERIDHSPSSALAQKDTTPVSNLSASVVIPTHNRAHLIGRALRSALRNAEPADEIIVVAYRADLDPADTRVITENLRWLLSKLQPTRWGDRLLLAGAPANPIEHLPKQVSLNDLTNEQLDALQAFCDTMLEHKGE